jgi:hypothetical protein
MSPLAFKADADAEVVRQASFLRGPIAKDVHVLPGKLSSRVGRIVTIKNPKLGYAAGVDVFVLGAVENENGTTTLTVLKRMA